MKKGNVFLLLGVGCLLVGAGVMANLGRFYLRNDAVGRELLKQATNSVSPARQTKPAKHVAVPKLSGFVGVLQIPGLSLNAPVVQGVADKQINVAVGHLTTSVMPGERGTSVLAAHNATWFRHINQLTKGDTFRLETKSGTFLFQVTQSKVVHVGDPIYNTENASMVLESCYPLDALYLTPYRYLVYAKLVQQGTGSTNLGSKLSVTEISSPYHVDIPSNIRSQGVTLQTNSLPMGWLHYTGHPNREYVQSNLPLDATSDIVQLFLAWMHASATSDQAGLTSLWASDAAVQNPLEGYPLSKLTYSGGFDVTLDVQNLKLLSATATTMVDAAQPYRVTVKVTVMGNALRIADIQTS